MDEFRQDISDCTEDDNRPCMKEFEEDTPDNQADNQVPRMSKYKG